MAGKSAAADRGPRWPRAVCTAGRDKISPAGASPRPSAASARCNRGARERRVLAPPLLRRTFRPARLTRCAHVTSPGILPEPRPRRPVERHEAAFRKTRRRPRRSFRQPIRSPSLTLQRSLRGSAFASYSGGSFSLLIFDTRKLFIWPSTVECKIPRLEYEI